MSQSSLPLDLSLEYFVVGFFDLLGQQDQLRNLRTLPDSSDPVAMANVGNILRQTYGAVSGMRKLFTHSFDSFIRKPLHTTDLPPETQATYGQMINNPIESRGFSDSMIVDMSMRTSSGAKLPVRGMLAILYAAGWTSIGQLSVGHPIRGGIDIGLGWKPSRDEVVYGPALSRAYALESRIATYPRVVVGDEMIRYLHTVIAQQAQDPISVLSRNIAHQCIECLGSDDDGLPFVDYLGPHFRSLAGNANLDASFIDDAYTVVLGLSERFKRERNSKLAFRYSLLRDYFDDRLSLWADLPRKKVE